MAVGWRDRVTKEKGHMDMDNSVVIVGGGGIREINGNGKHTIKNNFKKNASGNQQ